MTPHDVAEGYLRKAVADAALVHAVADDTAISDEIVGFHVQQAVEKALKAALVARQVRARWTHNLEELMAAVEESAVDVPAGFAEAAMLTPFAVQYRYPDIEPPEALDREASIALMDEVLTWTQALLDATPRDTNI